jgi:hypothetical protein
VDTVPDFPLNLAIAQNGLDVLVVSPFEGLRRSDDGGLSFAAGPLPVARLGCLTRPPGESTLFACSDVFFGGPWVVGRSEDFGRTWRPVLTAYTEAASAWTCTREAPARACCQHLCPGLAAGQDCPGRAAAPGPTCPFAAELQPDAGVLDASVPGDGGPRPDAGLDPDGGGGAGGAGGAGGIAGAGGSGAAGGVGGGQPGPMEAGVDEPSGGGGGGCRQWGARQPGSAPTVPLAWALGIGYCVWRARRRVRLGPLRRA